MCVRADCEEWKTLGASEISLQRLRFSIYPWHSQRTTGNGKAMAILLYTLGLSFNAIARIYGVATSTVMRWVRDFAEKTYEKPSPGEAVIIELDEMWHYLHSKKTNYGSGKLIVAIPVNSLTGNVAIVTKALLQDWWQGFAAGLSGSSVPTTGKYIHGKYPRTTSFKENGEPCELNEIMPAKDTGLPVSNVNPRWFQGPCEWLISQYLSLPDFMWTGKEKIFYHSFSNTLKNISKDGNADLIDRP